MNGSKERGEGGSERGREEREDRGRKGDREGGKHRGRYPVEDTGQYTIYSREHTKQNTTRP